ncbi:MAG: Gfo/Idh/MocA family oxidoreductase [Verrucomicrobia bacterium]|nr:Gfo/Idh/MocA family oxidoreductase [Verrucomicrobiota bacterium]
MSKKQEYGLGLETATRRIEAPRLDYVPREPRKYHPKIGLIGCGGITFWHLKAYRRAGYDVVALCDINPVLAEKRRAEFYPKAEVHTDYREILHRKDIAVVDIATHPAVRPPIIDEAIKAGKHVLSQKPFVLNLDEGERLVKLADKHGVRLAVNQNGRWAPHFSYIRQAIAKGVLGEIMSAHLSVHWNHDWLAGTPFDDVHHALLYDFAIHWFDIARIFLGEKQPRQVFACLASAPGQKSKPPLLGEVLIQYDGGQASLAFDAFTKFGPLDRTYLAGTKGSITSTGPSLTKQKVTLYTKKGYGSPKLRGSWFPDGFHGAMAELLLAIEENREPAHSARDNLMSLAICFAAVASADAGLPMTPGRIRRMPGMEK